MMTQVRAWIGDERALRAMVALAIFVVAWFFGRALGAFSARMARSRGSEQLAMIVRKASVYIITVMGLLIALDHLGLDLRVLLGAAGIFTVAIGFAAQTSASNLISGLFLLAERPFVVGDVICIGTTTGEVLTIDLLSVKLRTFDNLFVRIPNESVVKAEITNLSHFPLRRIDIVVGIGYGESIAAARDALMAVANEHPLVLDEPAPLFIFAGFGESSLDLQFSVWATRENFLLVKNEIHEAIKVKFDEVGIDIPFPQRVLNVVGLPAVVLGQKESSSIANERA